MVDQQNKTLEQVYNYLCSHPQSNVDEISGHLNLTNDNLKNIFINLQSMGLNIETIGSEVRLLTKTDIIECDSIQAGIIKHQINQEVIYHFMTQSTNQLAQNDKNNAIYISNYQSQGKGRQAKKWLTPLGQSIAMSMSHNFDCGLQKLSGLNIAVGVAIAKTLNQFGCQNIGLKWPNDVLGLEGKMAGILIEAIGNTQSCRAIIGIGINWNIQQALLQTIDQACSNVGLSHVSRSQFIIQLIREIHNIIDEFESNGLTNIQMIWKKYDVYLNKNVNLIQGHSIISGRYKGINKHGLLVVEVENELKTFASGEVSIRAMTN